MKVLLRFLGVILLVGGIFIASMAGNIEEATQPQSVQMGAVIDGEYVITDTGYIGGNEKGEDVAEMCSVIGVAAILIGAVALIGSFFVKPS
ncbi:MAG: hypothetical protein IJX76_01235 [Clostridia bacterium]|nr:hypothetical protein [Clostridia bacterium]